ncbi:hypothetical protein NUW58_g3553 [Xylaria curta]|uniref:Uncharacterized protein n=1 Tax=Xylaria curta TaxID=42375 RepID=A0ACC1PD53_9PEZI|nr:hypothetical protein NUW58_g3553 [Xylaria curta]
MAPQRVNQVQDIRNSSQVSGEDDEICSNKATSGSSDPGTDDLGPEPIRSQPSKHEHHQPVARPFLLDAQIAQTGRRDTVGVAQRISSSDGSSFRGLTPPTLPSAMLPTRKRSIGEVLEDESPPQKDKLATEIDQLAGAGPSQPYPPHGSSSRTRDSAPSPSPRRKKTRASEETSAPQEERITMGDPARNPDGPVNRLPERRSERIRTSRHNNRGSSN